MSAKAPAWARAIAAQQTRIEAELVAVRALLERQYGARHREGDETFRDAIAALFGRDIFSTSTLFLARNTDAELAAVLERFGIDSPLILGDRLGQLADGGVLKRLGRNSQGQRWQFVTVCCSNSTPASARRMRL